MLHSSLDANRHTLCRSFGDDRLCGSSRSFSLTWLFFFGKANQERATGHGLAYFSFTPRLQTRLPRLRCLSLLILRAWRDGNRADNRWRNCWGEYISVPVRHLVPQSLQCVWAFFLFSSGCESNSVLGQNPHVVQIPFSIWLCQTNVRLPTQLSQLAG